MGRLVSVMVVVLGSFVHAAEPVREHFDEALGALVFDASGENTAFPAPIAPREFANVEDYLKWILERFHGRPVLNGSGELVDVHGTYVLEGRPTYEFEGRIYEVRDPLVSAISGPFGFVVIDGVAHQMPVDEAQPPLEEIQPVLGWGFVARRRGCTGGPLGGIGYCVVGATFKHEYLFYQSVGGTVDLDGRASRPAQVMELRLRFQDASNRDLAMSSTLAVRGRIDLVRLLVSGISAAEWGVFGSQFVAPTKNIAMLGFGSGARIDGGSGSGEVSWTQRFW